jgi:Cation transporter/ATPase, N-terminus
MANTLEIGAEFNSAKTLAGLSDAEAASRIAHYGFNELPSKGDSRQRDAARFTLHIFGRRLAGDDAE